MMDSLLPAELIDAARRVVEANRAAGRTVALAESCTGGLVAAALTEIPGSSDVFGAGFVTYSNEAKAESIGVPMALIAAHGAVSEPVARAMAEGALAASRADLAVAVTGIAGPGGGSAEKPVGLVHFGLAVRDGATRHVARRFGDPGRGEIRRLSVEQALALLEDALAGEGA